MHICLRNPVSPAKPINRLRLNLALAISKKHCQLISVVASLFTLLCML